ncbi:MULTISPECIES: lactate/malate family dehydrogenase [unclassified Jeotgalibaca]|uniref:lactate/malate family dehydrogenase n=1 Tax=unclassified Jeotgalibaca TaxID=2621505 RepID=UPI003FD0E49E
MKTNKLVVIGSGHVGSQVVTSAAHLNLFSTITIIDKKEKVAEAEGLDNTHALSAFYRGNTTIQHGDYRACQDADIIVIAVAVPELPENENSILRTAWGKENIREVREVMAGITRYTRDAIIVIITNPVDSVTYIAENEFDYPKGKIFGTGTTLDTFRLRQIIARMFQVDGKAVSGLVIGEHGTTALPLFDSITISGIPFKEAQQLLPIHEPLTPDAITQEVVQTANDVFIWKGWTNTAIAEVAAAILRAIALDEKAIFPVCATIDGLYGMTGEVAFSTPCIIGKDGLELQIALPLSEEEEQKLGLSIADIKKAIASY